MSEMIKRLCIAAVLNVPLFAVSLDGLIAQAMENATVIKKSKAQVEKSRMKRQASKADRFGSIDLVGGFTHYNWARTLAPLTPATIATGAQDVPTTTDMYTMGVRYQVPLFTGFAQTRQVEMDRLAETMADSRLLLTKEQLAYNVASLYLSVLALEEMKDAQQKYVTALTHLERVIAKEVQLGKKARIDLLKAQKERYGAQAYAEVIRGNIEITKASLASLAGVDDVGALQKVRVSIRKPHIALGEIMAKAENLTRIKVAEYGVRRAEKGVRKSESSLLPQVSLEGYYGYNYGDNEPTAVNPSTGWASEKNWQIGVNAKWTVLDFGKRDATIQQAKIAHMEAAFDKEQTLRDLKKSLIEAREKMRQEYANYQSDLKQYALAQASEKIERVRYQNGVSTINDLLYATSQTQLSRAKMIQSKYNYQKGKYYMDYLLEQGSYKMTTKRGKQ